MPPISVTIIARDEADRIGEAIASVGFADEVVVVESGSVDDTAAVARAAGARVIQTDWPGHTRQKRRAVAAARNDWVLSLDADERVSPDLARELAGLSLATDPAGPGPWGYRLPRRTWWQGAPIRHGSWSPDLRVRLFHRAHGRHEGPDPHDTVVVGGPTPALQGLLHHHAYRDIGEHLATIAAYSATFAAEARARGQRARWADLLLRPPAHLVKALVLKQGLRDGARGLCIAGLGAAAVLLKYTLLMLPPPGSRS